jgi:hypothetical protein
MKRPVSPSCRAALVLSLSFAAQAHAIDPPPGRNVSVVTLEAPTGPVIVRSWMPEALPNAADYRVEVADLDGNGDGSITRREVPQGHALESEFMLVDRNRDGRISEAELSDWR